MSRYDLYTQVKDDTPIVTFKCEGCGKRFPSSKLYCRGTVISLKNGLASNSRGKFFAMVCSRICSKKFRRRSIQEFEAFWHWNFGLSLATQKQAL
jgi:hypothetical protein